MPLSNPLSIKIILCQTEKASSPLGGGYGDDDYEDDEEEATPIVSSIGGSSMRNRNTAASDGYEDYDDYESSANVRVCVFCPQLPTPSPYYLC